MKYHNNATRWKGILYKSIESYSKDHFKSHLKFLLEILLCQKNGSWESNLKSYSLLVVLFFYILISSYCVIFFLLFSLFPKKDQWAPFLCPLGQTVCFLEFTQKLLCVAFFFLLLLLPFVLDSQVSYLFSPLLWKTMQQIWLPLDKPLFPPWPKN